MEISFNDKKVRSWCEDADLAKTEFGSSVSKNLMNRLADIDAAESIEDLLVGNLTSTDENGISYCHLEIGEGFRLTFCSNHVGNNHKNPNGTTDWKRVSRIKILKIDNV